MSLSPQADQYLESFVVAQNCWDLLKWKYTKHEKSFQGYKIMNFRLQFCRKITCEMTLFQDK